MTYYDPRDPRDPRYDGYDTNPQNPPTQAYSGQADYGYTDSPQPAPKTPRPGPDVDPLMFCGGVLMTGVVTGLAAWLVAWIIRAITQRVNDSGKFGVWNPLSQDELWFAAAGFLVAIVAGAFWYLLQIATPAPDQFYRWVVGLLIAASVVIPLALSAQISTGIGTAIMHLIIGLPVLTLIPTMGSASRRKQQR